MDDQQRQETLESYFANLVSETANSNARITTLERLMKEASQMAQQYGMENEQLRNEMNSLKQKGQSNIVRVKPQKPEMFHGNRNEDVEGFLMTLERYLRLTGVPVENWVDFAASFLRHQADKWFRVQLCTYGENSRFAHQYPVFKQEFIKQFKPINSVLTARDRISQLRQMGSAIAYTHRFLELKLEIPDMSEAEAKDRYMRGLKTHVYQKVRLENPNSLSETIRVAQQFDEVVFNCRKSVGMFNRNSNAMELDAMDDDDDQKDSLVEFEEEEDTLNTMKNRKPTKRFQTRIIKKKPTSSQMVYNEKVRCMQSGLCFKCKEPGHRIRECPQWKQGKDNAQ